MENVKLVSVVMGGNCENTLPICLNSLKETDKIYMLFDSNSKDNTRKIVEKYKTDLGDKFEYWERPYDKEDVLGNSKAKQYFLNLLKEKHNDDNTWCLYLDADECIDDITPIKKFLSGLPDDNKNMLFSIHMRHFIYNLGFEDAERPIHFVPNRLFLIRDNLVFPDGEHTFCQVINEEPDYQKFQASTIWHLSYIPHIWYIKNRYQNHLKRSEMHSREFLKEWYFKHLFNYPVNQVNPQDIPEVILNELGIDKDEFYFTHRGLETKHFLMANQWVKYFNISRGDSILELGCGLAPFGVALSSYGAKYKGVELSKFAVENAFIKINQGDILTYKDSGHKLVIAFDVLEHIKYEDLDKAIDNLIFNTDEYILISVPVRGDPNLNADKTHIIKETKEWWLEQFTKKGLKLINIPDNFLFKNQIMVFRK